MTKLENLFGILAYFLTHVVFDLQGEFVDSKPKNVKSKKRFRRYQYEKGAIVEVRRGEEACKGSWYCTRVLDLVGKDRYIVEQLRFRGDGGESIPLNNGQWNDLREECCKPPLKKKRKRCESVEVSFRNGQWNDLQEEWCKPLLKKKRKRCERVENVSFSNGMLVEVRSDDQGYEGSWFSAKIVKYLGENRYTVEYQTLRTDDEKKLLKEEARGSDIRPPPPLLIQKRYGLYEYVDAWFNDGWWSGQVFEIDSNYTQYGVYFRTTHERLKFACNDLRPCQVWMQGKWSRA